MKQGLLVLSAVVLSLAAVADASRAQDAAVKGRPVHAVSKGEGAWPPRLRPVEMLRDAIIAKVSAPLRLKLLRPVNVLAKVSDGGQEINANRERLAISEASVHGDVVKIVLPLGLILDLAKLPSVDYLEGDYTLDPMP